MAIKIYTKTGDKGETSLFEGKRVPKYNIRVEAYGTVDELNSAIGVSIAEIQISKRKTQTYNLKIKSELTKIQNDLLDIGSVLASPQVKQSQGLKDRTEELESVIDILTAKISQLANFILPGGGKVGSHLHLCRTIARRAERRIVELSQKEKIAPEILEYFNRLSDFLFTIARYINHREKKKETIWKSTTK